MYKTYETKRLNLKTLGVEDAKVVVDYLRRNKRFVSVWEPEREDVYYFQDYQENILEQNRIDLVNGTGIKLWIFRKDNPYSTIGYIHFNNIIRGGLLSCYCSFRLDAEHINRGYMTEALNKGIDIIFNNYRLHRIEANIMPFNLPAIKVIQKLNFSLEGTSPKYLKINGKWEDHMHYVLRNKALE